jgi:hypothetical protein
MSKTGRKQPLRVRGYRIRIYRPGKVSVFLPLLWRSDTPTDEWERVTQDALSSWLSCTAPAGS